MENQEITVERLMSEDLVTVTPETTVEEAGQLLIDHDIGSLVVLDADDQLAGIVTSTDFLSLATGDESGADHTVEEYMTSAVVTVDSGASFRNAAASMMGEDVQHLPVEDADGNVVGMLSTTDLTAHMAYLD